MFKVLLTLWGMASASQAVALSCMAPNFAEDFNHANAAAESYVAAYGMLWARNPLPRIPSKSEINANTAVGQTINASYTFRGHFLTAGGFDRNLKRDVTVEISCAGPWCGAYPPVGQQVMVLMQKGPEGLRLQLGACGGPMVAQPSQKQRDIIEQCFTDGGCSPSAIDAFAVR